MVIQYLNCYHSRSINQIWAIFTLYADTTPIYNISTYWKNWIYNRYNIYILQIWKSSFWIRNIAKCHNCHDVSAWFWKIWPGAPNKLTLLSLWNLNIDFTFYVLCSIVSSPNFFVKLGKKFTTWHNYKWFQIQLENCLGY